MVVTISLQLIKKDIHLSLKESRYVLKYLCYYIDQPHTPRLRRYGVGLVSCFCNAFLLYIYREASLCCSGQNRKHGLHSFTKMPKTLTFFQSKKDSFRNQYSTQSCCLSLKTGGFTHKELCIEYTKITHYLTGNPQLPSSSLLKALFILQSSKQRGPHIFNR